MRVVNPLVRAVLTSRLLGRRARPIMLIEFEGRRSKRQIRVPVAVHVIDGDVIAFTGRPWRHNFTGQIAVAVWYLGVAYHGTGSLLTATPQQVGQALRTALDNGASPSILGLKMPRSYQPTIAELGAVGLSMIRFSTPDGALAQATARA
jgi:hypothetical protein